MSEHNAKIQWLRNSHDFSYEKYDRNHLITFDSGKTLQASAAPQYLGDSSNANPEELLAAALASCHMLTFLAVASRSHISVDSYSDEAVATLAKNAAGKLAVSKITLKPLVKISENTPLTEEKFQLFHEKAHANCFVANALSCDMVIHAEQKL